MLTTLNSLNINLLEQLIDLLQACFSVEEAYTAIKPLVQRLFPNEVGAIYVVSPSKNQLEAIATWGSAPLTSDPIFTPCDCLALRRGQAHLAEDTHYGLTCQHIRPDSLPVETFCVPMTVHGEPLGVLYIGSLHRGRITETKQLAVSVAKQIGLALANLKLRETLNNHSLRDPLTKLYNRHYLEESLEREIRKAERHPQSLGIILLNVDHVERINDQFGYEAGDFLLREIGKFLPKQIRASDIACRYRSKQFLLLLSEASLKNTQQRAKQLRESIKQLNLAYKNQSLGTLSISCGVASFAEHGVTGKAIIQAASAALNRAKRQGRDRVVMASFTHSL
jgi:diguanylate cyclase (GGDEF)-like protein